MQVPLSHQADVAGFHSEATRLLTGQVSPEAVEWSPEPEAALAEQDLEPSRAAIRNRAARAIIPQSFIRMSELVVLHRDPQRFDLLYRLLWRLVHEPALKQHAGDADLARLRQMAQAVRRDIQKMKVKLEFRPITVRGTSIAFAWYEPAHFVCELVGGWLATREPQRQFVLLTPERRLRWDGQKLLSAPALPPFASGPPGQDEEWTRVMDATAWG